MSLTVAIVGRPNVGKSTLFNRLVGKRLALVDKTPGLTRDRREGEAHLGDLRFKLIDTAGLEEAPGDTLESRMRAQTERAVADADLALFLIDARAGVTPLDEHFAGWLREKGKSLVLLANKCEGGAGDAGLLEAYGLGLGEPHAVSAEHGEGLGEIYDALRSHAGETHNDGSEAVAMEDGEHPLKLAIVGRPNVGKSTLVNRLLGEDRVLTDAEAGVTRDAITIQWAYEGHAIELVDTAGLRRKSRVTKATEELSVGDALRAIRFAEVVVLMLDAEAGMEKQDLTIARTVIEEGRVLVIAANKWDLISNRKKVIGDINDRLETSLTQVRGIPVITLSALTGGGVAKLMPAVLEMYALWNRRVSTAQLNRWLEEATERHPPPVKAGRRMRLRYMTQAKARPPTFVVFASRIKGLPEDYVRYLVNGLRETFDLPGVPLRLHLRKGKNPYEPG